MRNKKRFTKPVAQVQITCGSLEELQETLLQVSNSLLCIRKKLLLRALHQKVDEAEALLQKEVFMQSVSVNNRKRHRRHGHQESRK